MKQPASPAGFSFLASAPRGFADLLSRELTACGAAGLRERAAGVAFAGSLECAYRACLWSRIANRVFLEVAQFEARDAQEFHAGVCRIDWTAHLAPGATLACDFSGRHPAIAHTHFGALKLKDGIVDVLRLATGTRPNVAPEGPDVRVHAHARGTTIMISIDLSGDSLHRRGYRGAAGEAPLKENVAAGVLVRAGWPVLAAQGAQFLDPLCGSGTFCIEAALIALDRAPGLTRQYFGFLGWRGHDTALWARLLDEARGRAVAAERNAAERYAAESTGVCMRGADRDVRAIRDARDNAGRAGVERWVRFDTGALADAAPGVAPGARTAGADGRATGEAAAGAVDPPGLVCTNPPYGLRLEDLDGARAVHRELGAVLRERFQGWNAAVLTGAPQLGVELGLRAYRTHTVWNGGIECRLLRIQVTADSAREPGTLGRGVANLQGTPGARMFANRLAKNLRRLRGWAQREQVSCYRVYDADMPEYAFAIETYRVIEGDEEWLCVQEYAPPADIEPEAARRRRGEVLASLPGTTGVPSERIRLRTTRRRIHRGEQYRKADGQGRFHTVMEGGLAFCVNFEDYLDTGLFLDHRTTRARLRAAAHGKRFLNLFAYTGTATVCAAAGGAVASTSIDMSRTYLDWAQRNLALNGLAGPGHAFEQADCREWLAQAGQGTVRYDLVFLDPPTFSNSKRMQGVLDVGRDHAQLIDACARVLAASGLIVFSTNSQRFRLDEGLLGRYDIRDVSAATLPKDFERTPRVHRCYELRVL